MPIVGLAHWTTEALAAQIENMVAGYASASGAALPVLVRRAFSPDPPQLPEVYLEGRPGAIGGNLVGDSGVVDGAGNVYHHLYEEDALCEIGVRAKLPAERDDLLDLIVANLLLTTNPASGRRWKEELYTVSGLLPTRCDPPQFAPEQTTMFGQVYGATILLHLLVDVAFSVLTTPVASLTVVPNANLVLPLPFTP